MQREQLSSLQQQLQQGHKQLESADTALAGQRAAIADAEEQLAAVKREMSVCEPRLASLKQQLQELESNIRAREAEHQVNIGRWQRPVTTGTHTLMHVSTHMQTRLEAETGWQPGKEHRQLSGFSFRGGSDW